MLTVSDWLAQENAETLKHFSKLLGEDKKVTRKADLVKLVAGHLQGSRLRELWNRLDQLQQAAIAETIYSPTLRFDKAHFKAKYGNLPSLGEDVHYYFSPKPPLARILIHSDGISADLAARLKEFVPEPAPSTLMSAVAPSDPDPNEEPAPDGNEELASAATFEMEQAAQRDLKVVLLFVREGKLRVGDRTGLASMASMKAIGEVLTGGDFYSPTQSNELIDDAADEVGPIKPFAWPLLLQAAKLVVKDGTRLRLTNAGDKALPAAAHETISVIWKRWIEYTSFDEFRRIEAIKGQQGKARSTFTSVV